MNSFVFIALIGAIAGALSKILQKHIIGKIDEYAVAWSRYVFAVPFLFLFLWGAGIPQISPEFWSSVLLISVIEILVAVIFAKALKSTSISKTIPFLAFNPLSIALGGFILLGESLSFLQLFAILLIVVGSYILNIERERVRDVLAPFRLVWKEKGGLYILSLTLIWGFDIPFSKQATLASSPEFFTAIFFALTSIFFFPLFLKKSTTGFSGIQKNFWLFVLTGLFTSIFMVTLFAAARRGPIAVVSAIFSTSILITVFLAGTFLKEKAIIQRLVAAGIMTIGAIVLTII